MYADNEYKFVAVLNEKIELPKLLNALGHMTAGLVAQQEDREKMRFLQYHDGGGGLHPSISFYPFIVLKARNGNQIRALRQQAIEAGLVHCDFVDTMLGASAEDQLAKTRATPEQDLNYFGICLFGEKEVLGALTKKFSLFNS
ncbi:DUF2000 domain-containing protein (plasmid) [Sorangium sp. So ce119]|uniref:DUF2000 domain-containing protein n=1 Tax=Sorangium sp. So ce119 TaxID=3133279 RepID=UPI003F5FA504